MNDELDSIERKVEQVVALCVELRTENHRLRDRVVSLEGERQDLAERMSEARSRLEAIIDRLPAE